MRHLFAAFFAFFGLFAATAAAAQPSPEARRLEAALREQLDRMFEEKEYLLDVQVKPAPNAATADLLPGLALPQNGDDAAPDLAGSAVDVMLVVDGGVAPERARLAEDVAHRVLSGAGVKEDAALHVRRAQVAKPPPAPPPAPALLEPPPPAPQPKSLLEEAQARRGFLTDVAIVAWAALVSLLAVYGLVRRLSNPGKTAPQMPRFDSPQMQQAAGPAAAAPGQPVKDEKFFKENALIEQIADVVAEARAHPQKVARVLSRWVEQAGSNERYAAIFLRNCDIKTIESVSALLHPADVEKIVQMKIDQFDAFGDENQKVLELMRSDLAVLSAERVLRDRPDPLDFARAMAEDDVMLLLRDEPLETVALVATQIPPHRMQKFYASLDAVTLEALCAQISTVISPTFDDFEAVRSSLAAKAATLGGTLFGDKARVQTLVQVLQVISSPGKLRTAASHLKAANAEVYASVRPRLLLPEDVTNLPQRALVALTQSVEADTLGAALGGLGLDFAKISGQLPEAYRVVFEDRAATSASGAGQDAAWRKVVQAIVDLASSGLVSDREINAARAISEQAPAEGMKLVRGRGGRDAA